MRHVMSGFHFVLADFSDLNTVVQHTLNNPVHARFIRFNPVTFAYFPCMRVRCLRSEYRIISSDFFFSKKLPFPGAMKYIFFYLPWFISEKLGLGCLLEGKVLLFRSEVANLTKTLRAPHGNVSSQTVVSI